MFYTFISENVILGYQDFGVLYGVTHFTKRVDISHANPELEN